MAASLPEGLNGWVTIGRNCGQNNSNSIEIDGRGNFTGGGTNDRGLWVFINDPAAIITNPKITFYISGPTLTFSTSTGNSGWTAPAVDGSATQIAGYTAYSTTYSGTWTWNATYKAHVANGQPHFTASFTTDCSQRTAYARRSVYVNGHYIEFLRGPINV